MHPLFNLCKSKNWNQPLVMRQLITPYLLKKIFLALIKIITMIFLLLLEKAPENVSNVLYIFGLTLLLMKSCQDTHRTYLTHRNTITIPKTISEALSHTEWRNAMRIEVEALEQRQDVGVNGVTKREESNGLQMGFHC